MQKAPSYHPSGLSEAAEWMALQLCAHSMLECCACATDMMSVSSVRWAARRRCCGVGAPGCTDGCSCLSRTGPGRGLGQCITGGVWCRPLMREGPGA